MVPPNKREFVTQLIEVWCTSSTVGACRRAGVVPQTVLYLTADKSRRKGGYLPKMFILFMASPLSVIDGCFSNLDLTRFTDNVWTTYFRTVGSRCQNDCSAVGSGIVCQFFNVRCPTRTTLLYPYTCRREQLLMRAKTPYIHRAERWPQRGLLLTALFCSASITPRPVPGGAWSRSWTLLWPEKRTHNDTTPFHKGKERGLTENRRQTESENSKGRDETREWRARKRKFRVVRMMGSDKNDTNHRVDTQHPHDRKALR